MFDREKRIRERAYAIWEREGRPDGRHDEHWMRALAEIVDEDMAAGRLMTDALDAAKTPRPARTRRKGVVPEPAAVESGSRRTRQAAAWTPSDIVHSGKGKQARR